MLHELIFLQFMKSKRRGFFYVRNSPRGVDLTRSGRLPASVHKSAVLSTTVVFSYLCDEWFGKQKHLSLESVTKKELGQLFCKRHRKCDRNKRGTAIA